MIRPMAKFHTRVTVCMTEEERDELVGLIKGTLTVHSSLIQTAGHWKLQKWADRIAAARVARFPAKER